MIEIGKVVVSSQNSIQILIEDTKIFDQNKTHLRVSQYLVVEDGNNSKILATIHDITATSSTDNTKDNNYIISCSPIGHYYEDDDSIIFCQGGINIPSPTEPAYIPNSKIINSIFSDRGQFSFPIGTLLNNKNIDYLVNGNKFFGKHIAVVGSTGSGKSCAVARLLQNVLLIEEGINRNSKSKKNSHIIIFDIHSEYKSAFTLNEREKFDVNVLDVEKLCLPYWLMNSQELEALFIESNEMNSHNQISQFKKSVILSKEKHNKSIKNINYDTPAYFDINEVYKYIKNKNNEVINKKEGEQQLPKRRSGELITNSDDTYLIEDVEFVANSTAKDSKASNGPFNGDFDRFITRLETKLADRRLKFITSPKNSSGVDFKTDDFEEILRRFLGYISSSNSNVTIIDLSAIPFEVLSIVISLLSRLIFDFAFHYSKIKHEEDAVIDTPFMLVCEEAHNYIPKKSGAEYAASRTSIERIAKEGRKYGLSLMVVSQRPSEVSDTIFSQCNNFVVLKLTNVNDQNYIKNLLPDNNNSLVGVLPTLATGECLVVGDAAPLPAFVKMEIPNPLPSSKNVDVFDEWNKEWIDIAFSNIITRWQKDKQ